MSLRTADLGNEMFLLTYNITLKELLSGLKLRSPHHVTAILILPEFNPENVVLTWTGIDLFDNGMRRTNVCQVE